MSLGVITMSHPSHGRSVPLPTKHFCGGSGGSGRTPDRIFCWLFADARLDSACLQPRRSDMATPTPAPWGRDQIRDRGLALSGFSSVSVDAAGVSETADSWG